MMSPVDEHEVKATLIDKKEKSSLQKRKATKKEKDPSVSSSEKETKTNDGNNKPQTAIERLTTMIVCSVFLSLATFALYELDFVNILLYSTKVNRLYVNLGIIFSSICLALATYLDGYRKMILGEDVNYESAASTTHGMLFSIIAASICFNLGLWPVWGAKTLPITFMWFWGFLFQIVVIFPMFIQRTIFVLTYIWFMHSYLRPYMV